MKPPAKLGQSDTDPNRVDSETSVTFFHHTCWVNLLMNYSVMFSFECLYLSHVTPNSSTVYSILVGQFANFQLTETKRQSLLPQTCQTLCTMYNVHHQCTSLKIPDSCQTLASILAVLTSCDHHFLTIFDSLNAVDKIILPQ